MKAFGNKAHLVVLNGTIRVALKFEHPLTSN